MTVVEVIQRGSDYLAQKGVDSPRLQLELMLAHLLNLPRLNLYLNFDRVLTESEATALRHMVKRRALREPLQHILGTVCFCGLDFAVNTHVLVPRPETELLAEQAWCAAQQLVASENPARVLDFGTGSGCVAITVAVRCPEAHVTALDISTEAIAVARANAERHKVSDRVAFHGGELDQIPLPGSKFSLVVSNPPYIASADIASLMPEVRDYDPRLALDGGMDGLDFYRRLAVEIPPVLAAGGRCMMEMGDGQAVAVSEIFERADWEIVAVEKDYSGRERILIARLRN